MNQKNSSSLKIWGLTGGIGSGKSLVASYFEDLGYAVLDADQISRELSRPEGKAAPLIQNAFGAVSKEELRKQVFHSKESRKKLEAILHPLIATEAQAQIKKLSAQNPPPKGIIYEASLLIEANRTEDFEGIILITAPESQRKSWVQTRSGFSDELIDQIIASQLSDEEKSPHATFMIENDGTQDELKTKVALLAEELNRK